MAATATNATPNSPFIRELATSDARTRTEALEKLRTYISLHGKFSAIELLKLWKGLFFCMWMTDRPKVQHRMACELADLVEKLPDQNVIPFIDAFWITMAREWTGIDSLRMDKYLRLIRQYLAASFRYLSHKAWENKRAIDEYILVLEKTPLNPTDDKIPDGLRYHVLDIYIDELDKIDVDRNGDLPLEKMLGPVRGIAKSSPKKAIRHSANMVLGDQRLIGWNMVLVRGEEDSDENEDEDEDDDDDEEEGEEGGEEEEEGDEEGEDEDEDEDEVANDGEEHGKNDRKGEEEEWTGFE